MIRRQTPLRACVDCGRGVRSWRVYCRCRACARRHRRTLDGLQVAPVSRAYREANREKLAARNRAYYEANREKVAERNRAYYSFRAAVRERNGRCAVCGGPYPDGSGCEFCRSARA